MVITALALSQHLHVAAGGHYHRIMLNSIDIISLSAKTNGIFASQSLLDGRLLFTDDC